MERDYNRTHYELYAKENHDIISDARVILDLALYRPTIIIGNYCDYNVGEDCFPYIRISCYGLLEDSEIRFIIQKFEYGEPVEIVDLESTKAEKWLSQNIPGITTLLTK